MADTTLLLQRRILRLSGEGVRDWVQGLVTQDVAGPVPLWAALLSPQGKCLFEFIIFDDGADLLLDCEADAAADLARRLTLYRLRRPISIAVDDGLCVHWSPTGEVGSADPRLPALGRRWITPASEAAGADAGADGAWRAHRLRLGVTEGRAELGDLLWLECNAAELNGVSFSKGCFVGQENTARMNWRQKVNRRVVVVPLAEADPARQRVAYPELGWSVEHRRVEDIKESSWRAWMGER